MHILKITLKYIINFITHYFFKGYISPILLIVLPRDKLKKVPNKEDRKISRRFKEFSEFSINSKTLN